jgi:pyrimidine-nucleoside phosphorylase
MDAVEIIRKKRDGLPLTREEIRFFVDGYCRDEIADYQAAAWCMAIYLRGMDRRETIELTLAMAESGETLDLSDTLRTVIDKHSSGGVGDKTSLIVLPLVVACGVPVAKMSGRGLGVTGGTLDKLESIDGYNIHLTHDQFINHVREYGIVLAGQTADLAPADGKLYALRDVTATVSSKPLIASSIMCKKLAGCADGIVLDVKVGSGAFMETLDDARELAQLMVDIGCGASRRVTALLSDMNQPLGRAVGNAVEVRESIDTLRGHGPADLIEHCTVVAGQMLRLAGKSHKQDLSDIRPLIEEKLNNGEALAVFRQLVGAQGGNVEQVDNPDLLPRAPVIREVRADRSGYLSRIDAREVGIAVLNLGAGRKKKDDPIDHAVGAVINCEVGDRVEMGQPLFTVHARTEESARQAVDRLLGAHSWSDDPVERLPLFYDTIFSD